MTSIRLWLLDDDFCEDYLAEFPKATSCIDCSYYDSCFDRIELDDVDDLEPWEDDWDSDYETDY